MIHRRRADVGDNAPNLNCVDQSRITRRVAGTVLLGGLIAAATGFMDRAAGASVNTTNTPLMKSRRPMMTRQKQKMVTVVLVHAAWFDGSGWNKVTAELQHQGFQVVAAQIPLTSLSDDVAVLRRVLSRQEGPLVLVGHSYGGAVITAAGTGNPNVKALVYVAAIVPDEGETVGEVFQRVAPHPKAPQLRPDQDGFLWLQADAFRTAMAPDASAKEAALLAASQKPIALECLGEAMTKPAWKEKPSWFLIAQNDFMVSPDTQSFLAQRMRSTVVSIPGDHAPLISRPGSVVKIIEEAATAG